MMSEHWQAIAEQLDRADPAIMDTTRLSQRFRESPATVMLAILKDYNNQGQDGRRQQRKESPEMTVNEYHVQRHGRSHPTTALIVEQAAAHRRRECRKVRSHSCCGTC